MDQQSEADYKPIMSDADIAKMQLENEITMLRNIQSLVNTTGDNYIAAKTQIAGILVGLLATGLFSFTERPTFNIPEKVSFLVAIIALLATMIAGLMAIWLKSRFWIAAAGIYQRCYKVWSAYLRGESSYECARRLRKEITNDKEHRISNPAWDYIQSFLLATGVISLGVFVWLLVL